MNSQATELLAAEQILQRGVRIEMRAPFFLRWLGKKTISLKVRSPFEGTMQRVAAYYLSTGLQMEKLQEITHEQALELMKLHGAVINKAVACAWLNGYWAGMIFTKPLAAYLRWHCKPAQLQTVAQLLLIYGGVSDFMNTTRSIRLMQMTATAPNLGEKMKGS